MTAVPANDFPPKEVLEQQKLAAELAQLERDNRLSGARFLMTALQSLVVVVGVLIAVSEFVVTDRAESMQRKNVTLTLIERAEGEAVRASRDALGRLRDSAYMVPAEPVQEMQRFPQIVEQFSRDTRDIAAYYRVLERGVRAGYLDAELVVALIAEDIHADGEVLDDILARMGHPGSKTDYPDLQPFCGFYALRARVDPSRPWAKEWTFDPCERPAA